MSKMEHPPSLAVWEPCDSELCHNDDCGAWVITDVPAVAIRVVLALVEKARIMGGRDHTPEADGWVSACGFLRKTIEEDVPWWT